MHSEDMLLPQLHVTDGKRTQHAIESQCINHLWIQVHQECTNCQMAIAWGQQVRQSQHQRCGYDNSVRLSEDVWQVWDRWTCLRESNTQLTVVKVSYAVHLSCTFMYGNILRGWSHSQITSTFESLQPSESSCSRCGHLHLAPVANEMLFSLLNSANWKSFG